MSKAESDTTLYTWLSRTTLYTRLSVIAILASVAFIYWLYSR